MNVEGLCTTKNCHKWERQTFISFLPRYSSSTYRGSVALFTFAEQSDVREILRLEQAVEGRQDVGLILAPLELVLFAPHPLVAGGATAARRRTRASSSSSGLLLLLLLVLVVLRVVLLLRMVVMLLLMLLHLHRRRRGVGLNDRERCRLPPDERKKRCSC